VCLRAAAFKMKRISQDDDDVNNDDGEEDNNNNNKQQQQRGEKKTVEKNDDDGGNQIASDSHLDLFALASHRSITPVFFEELGAPAPAGQQLKPRL